MKIKIDGYKFSSKKRNLFVTFIKTVDVCLMLLLISLFLTNKEVAMNRAFDVVRADIEIKDDTVVNYLELECSNEDVLKEASCVNNYVKENFNYTVRPDILSPEELVKSGGDCKSWSSFYDYTMSELGWKTQFVFIDGHVFITAQKNEYYCNMDQENINCYRSS
jgi:hypothetical protein